MTLTLTKKRSKRKINMSDEKVEVLCKNCGQVFSAFLREMAEHNGKLTCPNCNKSGNYSANIAKPSQ